MTNAEIILQALRNLGTGWHSSRDVAWQARRDGYQMTAAKARGVCQHLTRAGKADRLVYGGRYFFEAKS
jgi:hypothetical protein